MITGTIVKNGKLSIIITGGDDLDMAALKQLDGAVCRLITDNYKLGEKSISGGLILEKTPNITTPIVSEKGE